MRPIQPKHHFENLHEIYDYNVIADPIAQPIFELSSTGDASPALLETSGLYPLAPPRLQSA